METEQSTLNQIFNDKAQNALTGFLLTDSSFFIECQGKIEANFFTEHMNQVIYKIQTKIYNEIKMLPPIGDIENHPIVHEEFKSPKEQQKFRNYIAICQNEAKNGYNSLDFLKKGITGWMQGNLFKRLIIPASNFYSSGKLEQAYEKIEELHELKRTTAFEDKSRILFSDWRTYLKEAEDEHAHAIPTGLKLLDEALLGPNAAGGLLPGDMTVVLAGTDVGKTSWMQTVAAHALLSGKTIYYQTFEGVPTDIRKRLLTCMMSIQDYRKIKAGESLTGKEGVDWLGLIERSKTAEGAAQLDKLTKLIDGNLVYSPLNKPGMTIEDVIPIIERDQDKRMSEKGKYFDLLVSDYPAKLQTRASLSGNQQNHLALGRIYDSYVQLAIRYRCHSLCAIQANREGYKINHGQKGAEERMLSPNDFAGSFDVSTLATNIISINRSAMDGAKDRAFFYVAKSKNTATGISIVARTRFGQRVTHADALGAVAYQGSNRMESKIDALLTEHKFDNTFIPWSSIGALGADKKGIVE